MEKLRIGCVVMAAGNASRFGENKLAARVDGKPLLVHALETVPTDRFCRVAVVTQYPEAAEAARRFSFMPVKNRHPDWGISHTISLGLDALGDCDAALFLVSDQPLLEQASVRELREDHGGSTVIRRHEDALLLYDVPARQLTDVDTRAALDALTGQEQQS